MYGILVGPISIRRAQQLHSVMHDNLLRLSNVYTSLQQAREWGMQGLQGTFPQCKKRLPSDQIKQRLVLESSMFINNFCKDIIGRNQITMLFNPEY